MTSSTPSHAQRFVDLVATELPSILHEYHLEIERRRMPNIDVLSLSTATDKWKKRQASPFGMTRPMSALPFASSSSSSMYPSIRVEPGVESGFCAIAVVGLRSTLGVMKKLSLPLDASLERVAFEFGQATKSEIKDSVLSNEEWFVAETFCAEWIMYQQMVSLANQDLFAHQTVLNPDFVRREFAQVRLDNVCLGHWKKVPDRYFLQQGCCLPFLGITNHTYDSCIVHQAVIERWKREESGQGEINSPILRLVLEHYLDLSKETTLAARTFAWHHLWSQARLLNQWIQSTASQVPTPETCIPHLPWIGKTKHQGVWKQMRMSCLNMLRQFLPREQTLAFNQWCQDHTSELDQFHIQVEAMAVSLDTADAKTLEIHPDTMDSDTDGTQHSLPIDEAMIDSDGELWGAEPSSEPPVAHTAEQEQVYEQHVLTELCRLEKDVHLAQRIPRWIQVQTSVLGHCDRYKTCLADKARTRLEQWMDFLRKTHGLVPQDLLDTYNNTVKQDDWKRRLQICTTDRDKWWREHTTYRHFRIIMYLFRWIGGIPYGKTDRHDSISVADFTRRLDACLTLEIEQTNKMLEGERIFARQQFQDAEFAQEIRFFVDGLASFQEQIQVFQKVCRSGRCCAHLETTGGSASRGSPDTPFKNMGFGASDTESDDEKHTKTEKKHDGKERKASQGQMTKSRVICVVVGPPLHYLTSCWDGLHHKLVIKHNSFPVLHGKVSASSSTGLVLLNTEANLSKNKALSNILAWLEKFTVFLEARNHQWLEDNLDIPGFMSIATQSAIKPRRQVMTLSDCLSWLMDCMIMVTFTSIL